MNGLDSRKASKVSVVECQYSFDAVHPHRGGQPRIVNLNSRNIVSHDQSPPFLMHRQTVGQQSEPFFKEFGPPVCFPGRKAVAVTVKRTGAGIPKFADILRRVAQHVTPPKHGINCRNNERMIAVARFDPAEKNIAIDEVLSRGQLAGPHRNSREKNSRSTDSEDSPILLPYLQAYGET